MSRKNAVVTGASRGIGRAICLKFASEGYRVAFCSRNPDKINELLQELKSISDLDHIGLVCDVRRKEDIEEFCRALNEKFDSLDVLVNNAGVFFPGKAIDEQEGSLEVQIETNLYSAYRFTRQLLPLIRQSSKGHIFSINSVAGKIAYSNGGAYSISKHAMDGFTKSIREELKKEGIRVTSLYPGATLTDSWAGTGFPEERLMPPEDIASILFASYNLSSRSVVEELIIRPQLGDL